MPVHRGRRTLVTGFGSAVALMGALGVLVTGTNSASAQSLAGTWAGGGTIVYPSGETERARCRATFRHSGGGGISMQAVCATPSVRVSQNAALSQLTQSTYSGEFTNIEYGISGSIRIRVLASNKLSASLNGGGATAQFSLNR